MSIPNPTRPAPDEAGQFLPAALSDCEGWYAVYTLPFAEARAEAQLQRQGFWTFQPKRYKSVRHARRLNTVEAPFFPRYLFVVLDLTRHQWRRINGTWGVSRLVMCGEQPHAVPRGVVEALIAAAGQGGILQLAQKLHVGGPVRLMAGPFAEQLAILEYLDDSGRVQVLLEILGRQVAISTGANNVVSGVIKFCECLRQYLADWSLLAFHSVFSGAKTMSKRVHSEPVAQVII
jgi:transcription elongation factor/antiterminator RfaH